MVVKTIFACFTLILCQRICTEAIPIAKTPQGTYIGQETKMNDVNVEYWYGIPYAQQPIGELRWKPPQPLEDSNTIYKADSPNVCPQRSTYSLPMTESCLTLNVYAPENAHQLPVYVWIHGGSFTSGAGAFYDGGPFITTSVSNNVSVIIVTINYRLGLLGFMADQALFNERSGTNSTSTTGNYGILDQMMALQWIKSNIQAFGGDPNQITIGGESAGGISVTIMLTSPLVETNTFQRAIIESGNLWPDAATLLSIAINNTGDTVREITQCTTLECLRSLTVDQLLSAQDLISSKSIFGAAATPVIDGYVLLDAMENSFAKGDFIKVPVLVGSTENETSLFTCPYFHGAATPAQVANFFSLAYNNTSIVSSIPQFYGSVADYSDPLSYLNAVYSDSWAHCGARRLAAQFSNYGLPIYLYTYNHLVSVEPTCLGVAHATELPFLFPSLLPHVFPNYNFTESEKQLSTNMILYWSNFIRSSNPNYITSPAMWDIYQMSSDADFVIDIQPYMRNHYYFQKCTRFWDNFSFEPHEV